MLPTCTPHTISYLHSTYFINQGSELIVDYHNLTAVIYGKIYVYWSWWIGTCLYVCMCLFEPDKNLCIHQGGGQLQQLSSSTYTGYSLWIPLV
ncbi:hypothetical protein MUK42_20347 [Musa troglodytarum]|nr:hypothetical protein MUK42_20347 [Musa troglodytarum]